MAKCEGMVSNSFPLHDCMHMHLEFDTHCRDREIFAEATMMYLILDSVTPALDCLDAVRNYKVSLLCTAVWLSTWSISNAHSIALSP